MNRLTVGSLFSGIGGIDLGLKRAGFEIVWQVEINEYRQKVLAKRFPNAVRYGDIRTVGKHNLPAVDLLVGGFPCQPHSLAGSRKASEDERDLWGEFYRVICEIRPAWVLAENVPGLLSSEDGRFFGGILRDLAALRYDAEWQCIPAAALGAPHIRERVFIVAYPTSQQDRRIQQQGVESDIAASNSDVSYASSTRTWMEAHRSSGQEWQSSNTSQPTLLRQEHRAISTKGTYSSSENVADPDFQGLEVGQVFGSYARQELPSFKRSCSTGTGQWAVEPRILRVADGVPSRVERLRGLGDSVVSQVAEYIGRCILASLEIESEVAV